MAISGFLMDKTLFISLADVPCDNLRRFLEHIVELSEIIPEAERLVCVLTKDADTALLRRPFQQFGKTILNKGFEMVHPSVYSFGDDYELLGIETND
jgi:hypothetical protein